MTDENQPTNQVTLILRGKEFFVPGGLFVHQALKRIGLNAEAYLVVRDGEVITEDQMLRSGDRVRVVPVISGGCGTA